MSQIGYGIIGTGMIANIHARAIAEIPEARLAAVYDCVPERARAFAERHGTAAESDLESFLARTDVDAVTITTPSGVRADVAVPAARAGKHVLCEKPLEVTIERADRIIRACEESGVILGCVFQARTAANVRRIREALDAGRFGRLVLIDAQVPWFRTQEYYDSAAWRGTWKLDGGGTLMNQSIHIIDLMLYFAGVPRSVYAFTDTLTHTGIEVEDTAVAAVRLASGALGTITASTCCAPGFPRRLEIAGERGSVVLEDDRLTRWSFVDQSADDDRAYRAGLQSDHIAGGAGAPDAISHEGHRRQIEDLTRAILEGRQPMVSGREARRAVELICGIYESARTGLPFRFSQPGEAV
jgi:predicted dehydrogenase